MSDTPKYSEEILEDMVDYAVRKLSKRLGVGHQGRQIRARKPRVLTKKFHDTWRCEKCKIFKRKCC